METTAYNIEEFIQCCKNDPKSVDVLYDAESLARKQFGLNTKSDLLAFIGNGGLLDLDYDKFTSNDIGYNP